MPKAAFISAMPSPDIPLNKRPWRQQRNLNEADFIDECRGWDISEVVFSTGMWPMYQPLLRADFTIFDEYEFRHAGKGTLHVTVVLMDYINSHAIQGAGSPPFTFPAFTYWGTLDRRVKEDHVGGWKKFFSGPFSCEKIEGNHLWPLDKSRKAVWLDKIVTELDKLSYS